MKTYTVDVYEDGSKYWFINNQVHREDGPAIEWSDGTKFWHIKGKLHREDGPAIEHANGTKFWYIDGEELTQKQFNDRNKPKPTCAGKVVEIDGVKYKLVKA